MTNEPTIRRFIGAKVWDPKRPTDPRSYADRGFAQGTPLHWRDDVTGTTQQAIMAYLEQNATAEQIALVIAYVQHHIHAPCWLESSPYSHVDEEMATAIRALRARSLTLVSATDVNQYIRAAMEIGLDPL